MLSRQGPEIDIEEFYLRYGALVLRRCRRLLQDEERARDAAQEVFANLLMHKEQLEDRYPSSLLYRMATNTCLNILRDHRFRSHLDGDAALERIAAYDESENTVEAKNLLEKIFRKEKASTREIAVLHFVDGLTLQEVAEEIGLSVSGVRKRIRDFRARVKNMREIYDEP
jgi:RNA polymerase sigma-70 factor, ECF subfamily